MRNIIPKIPEGAQRFYTQEGDTLYLKRVKDKMSIYSNKSREWSAPTFDISSFWEESCSIPQRTLESSAVETLTQLGYTCEGGELWKPPIGKKPVFTEDLTTLTEPFGDLHQDTQLALVKHLLKGGELNCVYRDGEVYGSIWFEDELSLDRDVVYSVKDDK
jgi:hypothetical protein